MHGTHSEGPVVWCVQSLWLDKGRETQAWSVQTPAPKVGFPSLGLVGEGPLESGKLGMEWTSACGPPSWAPLIEHFPPTEPLSFQSFTSNSLPPCGLDRSPPGSSVQGILRQGYWRGLPWPSLGLFPIQGSNPHLLLSGFAT